MEGKNHKVVRTCSTICQGKLRLTVCETQQRLPLNKQYRSVTCLHIGMSVSPWLNIWRAERPVSKLGDAIYFVVCISPAMHCNSVSFLNVGQAAPYPYFSKWELRILMHSNIWHHSYHKLTHRTSPLQGRETFLQLKENPVFELKTCGSPEKNITCDTTVVGVSCPGKDGLL